MKKFIQLIIFTFSIFPFSQQITGSWKGEADVQGMKLPLIVHIIKKDNGYSSTFDSPMQGAKDIPFETTTFNNNVLELKAPEINFVYRGKLQKGEISGKIEQNGMSIPMVFKKIDKEEPALKRPQTPVPPFPYQAKEFMVKNEMEGNLLAGEFVTPKNFDKEKTPFIIMITGSGTQNRDEELFGHKPFLVIADYLARNGIASFRMDDRGIGKSEDGKPGATTKDFAGDISSAVNFFSKKGIKNIGLLGHSEGGMIAPMVATENSKVKFLVLLAAPGVKTIDLLQKQTYDLMIASNMDDVSATEQAKQNRKLYDYVVNYNGNNLEADVRKVIISDIQKTAGNQLTKEQMEQMAAQQASQLSLPWFQYFLKFNPEVYLSKVKVPVLALNGTLDMQVSAKENLAGIKNYLQKAGNKNFEIVELPGLNHLFQTAQTGSVSEYGQLEETFSPKAMDQIKSWILRLK